MKPLLKWVGGKRQLLAELTRRMPDDYHTYFEPFFGGGALYFHIAACPAVINDQNSSLIRFYQTVQNQARAFLDRLAEIQDVFNHAPDMDAKKAYYLSCRDVYNACLMQSVVDPVNEAALLVFLNKAGFNGLYRVNSEGLYNVPFGQKETVNLFDRENVLYASELLGQAEILNGDFERAVYRAGKQDFVFFDSPYYGTFDQYQKNGFSESDHRRLAGLFADLTDRGVYCMLTNSDTDFIRELYHPYRIEQVSVRRSVNRSAAGRTGTELIVRNY